MSENYKRLKQYAETLGLTMDEAADDVLLHYNAFDYSGKDKTFLEFCENFREEDYE